MLIASLVLSGVLLLALNVTAFWSRSILLALPWCCLGLVGLGFCMVILPALLLHAALTLTAGLACAWLAPRPRVFLPTTITTFLIAYVGFGIWSLFDLEKLRHQSAPVSLVERLAYEEHPVQLPEAPTIGPDVRLISMRSDKPLHVDHYASNRASALKMLHEDQVAAFVASAGVGIGRAPMPIRYEVHMPETPPILIEETEWSVPPESAATMLGGGNATLEKKTSNELESLHADSVSDFVFPEGFGYVKDRNRVIGFRPHRFSVKPSSTHSWRFRKLELVSLLKHDKPAVYVSDNLPRMSELRHAATRPLDAFEAAALPRLGKDDLVIHSTDERLRVLGSIRAAEACLNCHTGKQGDLLGAFSYSLDRKARK